MHSIVSRGRATKGRRLAALALYAGIVAGVGTLVSTATLAAPGAATAQVRMHDIAFLPQSLAVTSGTTITWTNDDDMTHTVTSGVDHDDGVWTSSPSIPPGGAFSLTLSKPGTYRYYCKPHMYSAAMHASIVVAPAGH